VRGFSRKSRIIEFVDRSRLPSPLGHVRPGLSLSGPQVSTYGLGRTQPSGALDLPYSVPAHINAVPGGAGILTCFPSPTPLGLGLGSD
jgi:hypothetical protein